MKTTKLLLFVLFITTILFLTLSLKINAHVPLDTSGSASKTDPIQVEDHKISWAAYRKLQNPGQVDYYSFQAKAGEEIYASMVIPLIDRLEDFRPMFALIGPGLQDNYANIDPNIIEDLLIIEKNEGVIVVIDDSEGENEIFYEPFTQTSYWRRQEKTMNTTETGTYYLAVFSPAGQTGKYTFAIGREEKWGLSDIIKMPKIWWDTRIFVEKETSTYIITGIIGISSIYLLSRLFK